MKVPSFCVVSLTWTPSGGGSAYSCVTLNGKANQSVKHMSVLLVYENKSIHLYFTKNTQYQQMMWPAVTESMHCFYYVIELHAVNSCDYMTDCAPFLCIVLF